MAKQTGDYKITGTYDNVTYYQMDGEYYARSKSCLKGERVKRDPKFKRTMQSANRFGRGNQLASKVYRSLPGEEQKYTLFKELKRIAILEIKEGKSEEEVVDLLQQRLGPHKQKKPSIAARAATTIYVSDQVWSMPFYWVDGKANVKRIIRRQHMLHIPFRRLLDRGSRKQRQHLPFTVSHGKRSLQVGEFNLVTAFHAQLPQGDKRMLGWLPVQTVPGGDKREGPELRNDLFTI